MALSALGGAGIARAAAPAAATTGAADALAPFFRQGSLSVSQGTSRFLFPFDVRLLGVSVAVGTAPLGAPVVVDVNCNGTTLFPDQTRRPSVADGASSTASEAAPSVSAVRAGDYLTVDVDSVGSVEPGADLTVFVRYRIA